MPSQDKALLMTKVEETLKPRMFANLLEEAVDEIQEHLDEFDVTHTGTETIETEDLLKTYIDAKRVAGRSERTLVHYQYVISRFMRLVGVRTRDVTPQHIRDYFARLFDRGVSDCTVNGIRETINAYFGWLKEEGLIKRNPCAHIEPIKVQQKERPAFSDSDIELLKMHCTTIRDRAILCFLLSTGCRISEMTGLNREDVDLDAGECIVLGKGNKERTVFLDDVAVMTLREYLASRIDRQPALFLNHLTGRISPQLVREMLHDLGDSANVDNVHPHRFRRTIITRLLNRGMPIQDVALIAGHAKIDTTKEYYAASKSRIKSNYVRFSS